MITIISGDIRSGKTTLARRLYRGSHVGGIVAPGDHRDRCITNLATGHSQSLVAGAGDKYTIEVGRYILNQDTIDWANNVLLKATQDNTIRTIVVDEIGPLELSGQGHADALYRLIEWSHGEHRELVVVIRAALVAAIWHRFFDNAGNQVVK